MCKYQQIRVHHAKTHRRGAEAVEDYNTFWTAASRKLMVATLLFVLPSCDAIITSLMR